MFKKSFHLFWLFCAIAFARTEVAAAEEMTQAPQHSEWSFTTVGLIPIQNGGRVKPFDSFAREAVMRMTGSVSFQKWNAVDLLLSWIAFPQVWENQKMVRVGREDVKRQLGLPVKQTHFTPHELFKNPTLLQLASNPTAGAAALGMSGAMPSGMPGAGPKGNGPREQELKAVLDRLGLFHNMITGQGWSLVPKPLPQAWTSLVDQDQDGTQIRKQFIEVLKAYQAGEAQNFERSALMLRGAVEGEIPNFISELRSKIEAEAFYNRLRPFRVAWVLYLLSALTGTVVMVLRPTVFQRFFKGLGHFILFSGLSSHVAGMALRSFVAGRPPVTNMYESVIWVSFGVVLFAMILYTSNRHLLILILASALACLGLVTGDSAPAIMDPSIQPLVPVLRSNYWLTIHVLTITLGYAAFALNWGLANATLFQFMRPKSAMRTANIQALNQLAYRAIQFGVVLIAAGTILGGIWADYSWGRFWGWDPKEVWALITLLCYLVILHGRYTNWVGQFSFAVWSILSFMSVIMAWYGVNFILGVGLHSYGFSTGGTPWVIGGVAVQLLYLSGVLLARQVGKADGAKSLTQGQSFS